MASVPNMRLVPPMRTGAAEAVGEVAEGDGFAQLLSIFPLGPSPDGESDGTSASLAPAEEDGGERLSPADALLSLVGLAAPTPAAPSDTVVPQPEGAAPAARPLAPSAAAKIAAATAPADPADPTIVTAAPDMNADAPASSAVSAQVASADAPAIAFAGIPAQGTIVEASSFKAKAVEAAARPAAAHIRAEVAVAADPAVPADPASIAKPRALVAAHPAAAALPTAEPGPAELTAATAIGRFLAGRGERAAARSQPAPAEALSPIPAPAPGAGALPPLGLAPIGPASEPTPALDTFLVQSGTPEAIIERQLEVSADGEWLDQLARDIAGAGATEGRMRFRLDPEHLGHLDVELMQSERGLSVRLTADNEASRALLADAQPRLTAEARAQGVRIAETQIDLSGGHAGDSRRQESERRDPLLRTAAEMSTPTETADSRTRSGDRYA